MNNVKNICIAVMTILLVLCIYISPVYAETSSEDKQKLIDMLNQYKNDLGDLNQVKTVVDQLYSDINSASTVDDNLKKTLTEDINMLDNVTGMNPLILTVLKSELSSQVEQLSDSNLSELKDEVAVIKEWVDAKVGTSEDDGKKDDNKNNGTNDGANNDSNNNGNKVDQSNPTIDPTTSGEKIPYAGAQNIIKILVVIAGISIIVFVIKYRELKEIK